MCMNTNYEFHLMQLADSFFPSGMFGMSSGLESFVKYGKIITSNDVLKFIKQQIKFQLVPCDCVILILAIYAAQSNDIPKIVDIDNRFNSMRLVREVRNASVRSGPQMLNCVMHMTDHNKKNKFAHKFMSKIESKETAGTYPVCLGIAANCLGIPKKSAIKMMLYSYSISIIGAAIRLGVIQHLNGQRILTQLSDDINTLSKSIKKKSINNIWQLTPLTDILQMNHEHDDYRMFIT